MSSRQRSTLLVMGGASRIGRAVARRFARRNWRIGLLGTEGDDLDRIADEMELGTEAFTEVVDPTDGEHINETLRRVRDWSDGRLDILLNAVGTVCPGRFEDLTLRQHRDHIDTNLWATLATTHAAFPLLKATEGARVISIASSTGMYGTPDLASYSASKAGVRALTQALNLEWAHHDIHVCDVIPPYTTKPDRPSSEPPSEPKSREDSGQSSRRLPADLTIEDVVDVVDEAVAEDKIHWPVGQQFQWIYRLSDVLPAPLVRLFMRYISGF